MYFKRDDSNRWRGPGTVIGQDRQVVFVRHGGVFVRVPTCRLKKVKSNVVEQLEGDVPCRDINNAKKKVEPIVHPNSISDEEQGNQVVGGVVSSRMRQRPEIF